MKKKTVRVVLAGYGSLGEELARLLAAEPCCRIVAVADPSPRALEKAISLYQVSTFPTFAKALEATDADAAVIATPPEHSHALAADALERGLHVVVAADPSAVLDYLRELEAVVLGKARGPASRGNR